MLLDGLHIPVTTPFYPDGRLYLRKLEHNVERYSRTPATSLTLLSDSGERTLLSDAETQEVLQTAASASAPEKVLIANISRDSVVGTLELADAAGKLGYDAIALQAPQILGGDKEGRSLLTYFGAVLDRSPLPTLILDPDDTLPLDCIAELAANPACLGLLTNGSSRLHLRRVQSATAQISREVIVTNIFAAVTGRMNVPQKSAEKGSYISADSLGGAGTALATAPPRSALKTRTKKVGFQILAGRTASLLDALEAGAAGAVLPLAACAPQAVYEVFAAWKDGDPKLAAEKQARLLAAAADIEERLGVAALKAACDLNGYYGGKPRLPHLPLTGEMRTLVETLMAGMRN